MAGLCTSLSMWIFFGYTKTLYACACPGNEISKRISGPLSTALIRHSRIEVPRVDYEKLSGDRMGESSDAIEHVFKPREIFNESDLESDREASRLRRKVRRPFDALRTMLCTPILYATPTCVSVRFGSSASY